ncbi:MAG: RNA-binding protein [Bacteroidetes bacterium]|nr:RNA-binding protein [Bacteroidota bacterium]
MKESLPHIKNGKQCEVIKGTYKGKNGTISDINWSKSGNITITVTQENGIRFKTLGRNVQVLV